MVDIQEIFNKVLELQTRIEVLSEEIMKENQSYKKSVKLINQLMTYERGRKALNKKLQEKDFELFILSNLVQ